MNAITISKVTPFVILLILAGCDGHTSVKGVIQDEKGKPIVGATVTLAEQPVGEPLRGEMKNVSDENGRFTVWLTHPPSTTISFKLTVSKPGYKSRSELVTYENRDRVRTIKLQLTEQ